MQGVVNRLTPGLLKRIWKELVMKMAVGVPRSQVRTCVLAACVLCSILGLAGWQALAAQNNASPTGQEQVQPTEQKSTVAWFIKTSGVIGAVILLLSVYFIATVGKLFVELRHEVAMPPSVLQLCEDVLEKKEFMGIYKLLKTDKSFFSRVLFA